VPKNIQSLTTSSLWGRCEPSKVKAPSVERMKEYQRAARMPALQCFIPDLEIRDETCADILSDAKCFILCFEKKTFCTRHFRLRHFTIICNTDEYKMMGQDLSLGQLFHVQN
jgi:hypothetical protein